MPPPTHSVDLLNEVLIIHKQAKGLEEVQKVSLPTHLDGAAFGFQIKVPNDTNGSF